MKITKEMMEEVRADWMHAKRLADEGWQNICAIEERNGATVREVKEAEALWHPHARRRELLSDLCRAMEKILENEAQG